MQKKIWPVILAVVLLLGVCAGVVFARVSHVEKNPNPSQVYFGGVPVSEYIIVSHMPGRCARAVSKLNNYVEYKTGKSLGFRLLGGDAPHTISMICDKNYSGQKIIISDGKIILYGKDSYDCLITVQAFANTYLGFSFAGQEREALIETGDVYNSGNNYLIENPWIEKREPIICLWKTNVPRGQFYNTGANLSSEILTYSDKQLYEYVRMMKTFGFSGIQVTDMCSAWAQYSGYEFVHDRLRYMADAAHSMDMDFTLWVWGAEFDGYSWVDDSVVYHDYANYQFSFECPEAYATFNKYYDIYAELADCSDRVIAHFDDPSNIHDSVEIATYAKLLRDKFKEINPDINFGVSDYTNKYDKYVLAEELGSDVTVYCGASTQGKPDWKSFRTDVLNSGTHLGVWSWNLCEMEIDQLAEMNVNANLIRDVYLSTIANGDEIMKPEYWSEMDSYHLANIFSLYCAGSLLQNPALSADDLLKESAVALVGQEYGDDLYQILKIIEDARTGSSWNEFKWSTDTDEYLLTSDKYPYVDILARCDEYGGKLDEIIKANPSVSTIPLPFEAKEVLSIVRSHLEQIRRFAEFRNGLAEAEEMLALKASENALVKKVTDISTPIPNFDVLVGVWGQPESIAQIVLLNQFCKKAGIDVPMNPVYKYRLKQYIYQEICAYQKKENKRLDYDYVTGSLFVYVLGEDSVADAVKALIDEGIVMPASDSAVYLTDWQDYIFTYN